MKDVEHFNVWKEYESVDKGSKMDEKAVWKTAKVGSFILSGQFNTHTTKIHTLNTFRNWLFRCVFRGFDKSVKCWNDTENLTPAVLPCRCFHIIIICSRAHQICKITHDNKGGNEFVFSFMNI